MWVHFLIPDHISSFQEVPRGLQYYSKLFRLCRGGIVIQIQDIILMIIVTIWESRSVGPECTLNTTSLFSQVISRSFEIVVKNFCRCHLMLRHLPPRILLLYPSSSLTLSPRSTTRSLYFWRCFAATFFKWQMSVKFTKSTVFAASSFDWWLQILISPSFRPILECFSHSLSTAALTSVISTASDIVITSNIPFFVNVVHMLSLHFSACIFRILRASRLRSGLVVQEAPRGSCPCRLRANVDVDRLRSGMVLHLRLAHADWEAFVAKCLSRSAVATSRSRDIIDSFTKHGDRWSQTHKGNTEQKLHLSQNGLETDLCS